MKDVDSSLMERTSAVESLRSADVAAEQRTADFGDKRLSVRCGAIVEALVKSPGVSLPCVLADDAELMSSYRFCNNPKVNPQAILLPHAQGTARRARAAREVLVIHDTTEAKFTGEHREGLGSLSSGGEGFFAHVSLVVAQSGGLGLPLGVAALQLHTRPQGRKAQPKRLPLLDEGNERRRWALGVEQATEVLGAEVEQIHVMDREGDHYELLAFLRGLKRRFVVRLSYDRNLFSESDAEARRISQALSSVAGVFQRVVHLGARELKSMPDANKKHPPRAERDATLSFASTTVRIKRPHGLKVAIPESIELNLVRVWEENPPDGELPVNWILSTTEPVESPSDIERVVDIYRLRWLIEEYFKAMKSGCSVEERGFLRAHALQNVFALTLPVAWQMLVMRTLSRLQDQSRAQLVLSSVQLMLLAAATRKLPPRQRTPPEPTVRQALLAIAALGGHLTRNGDPGWHSIARGFERLRVLEEGYRLAQPDSASP